MEVVHSFFHPIILYLFMNSVDALFVREAVPNSVASHNNEIVVFGSLKCSHVRETCNSLFLLTQMCLVFELEIPKGSAKGKITINSVVLDKMLSLLNSGCLYLVLRLVILT